MATHRRDYYEILGVPRSATSEEIRNAYRTLAKRYHPDVNKDPGAEETFKEVSEAYGVLSDEQRRMAYDRFGHAGVEGGMPEGFPGGFGGLGDLFEEFFRGFGASSAAARRSPRRGADLQAEVTLAFDQAASGVEKEIRLERLEVCEVCRGSGAEPGTSPVRCTTCRGSGEVRQVRETFLGSMVNVTACPACKGTGEVIPSPCKNCKGRGAVRRSRTLKVPLPAGVDEGTQIRLPGEGEPGLYGGPQGNLYLTIHVEPHPFMRRKKDDLWVEIGINLAQAALGAEVQVPTLNGPLSLTLPAGTQSGQVFRMRGKGIPHLQAHGQGDLLILVNVQIPSRLSSEQKRLLRQLGDTLDPQVAPQTKGLLDTLKDSLGD
ncbi:MAG: molecular chaperone DnaJ [Anaerolineales bacterium]|jgi:molecular chaperone DnaJ